MVFDSTFHSTHILVRYINLTIFIATDNLSRIHSHSFYLLHCFSRIKEFFELNELLSKISPVHRNLRFWVFSKLKDLIFWVINLKSALTKFWANQLHHAVFSNVHWVHLITRGFLDFQGLISPILLAIHFHDVTLQSTRHSSSLKIIVGGYF